MRILQRNLFLAAAFTSTLFAQPHGAYTWEELRSLFLARNPTLMAGQLNIQESAAQEITASLRPNPDLVTALDQLAPFTGNPYRPFQYTFPLMSASYLHERGHKRELRVASAREGTRVAEYQQQDLARTTLFTLRTAFLQALQAKALVAVSQESLAYYDKLLAISEGRYRAGDISQVDFERLELQRVQFASDVETARVNSRTARIQLLTLLADRTPVDQFDVTGDFDFHEQVLLPDELRQAAIDTRPDLKAAVESVNKAQTDHRLAIANGTADPTFSMDLARNPPIAAYVGVGVNIPLRIFDRNQGEKLRTSIDIRRNERLREANYAQVIGDVDSAYASLNSALTLLRPYRSKYLDEAARVRETMSYAYQRGGASLLDFLSAQNDYRSIRINYLNLVGAYLTAAAQLNLAVGREVVK